jgi:hypothetical protein
MGHFVVGQLFGIHVIMSSLCEECELDLSKPSYADLHGYNVCVFIISDGASDSGGLPWLVEEVLPTDLFVILT